MAFPLGNRARLAALALALTVAGCGGGGGGGGGGIAIPPPPSGGWTAGTFLPAASFANRCAAPSGASEIQGTATTENNWLRSWSNDLYLWYDEIVDRDPALYTTPDYFARLKTTGTTPSGKEKDRFHYTYPTAEWLALSQSGVSVSYGIEWAVIATLPPRRVRVAYTEPASPAANLARGGIVAAIDGIDVINTNDPASIESFVNALYPDQAGETHTFTFADDTGAVTNTMTLTAAAVTATPVRNVQIHQTGSGPVGYVLFNDHLATAEHGLYSAIEYLQAGNVTDLVLDIR